MFLRDSLEGRQANGCGSALVAVCVGPWQGGSSAVTRDVPVAQIGFTSRRPAATISAAAVALGCQSDLSSSGMGPQGRVVATTASRGLMTGAELSELQSEFGATLSLDSTLPAAALMLPVGPFAPPPIVCRDHFNDIDMWWSGPYGLVSFHLPRRLLLVGFRGGSYKGLAKALYETTGQDPVVGSDNSGHAFSFSGRFNALCRFTEIQTGGIHVFGAGPDRRGPCRLAAVDRRGNGQWRRRGWRGWRRRRERVPGSEHRSSETLGDYSSRGGRFQRM